MKPDYETAALRAAETLVKYNISAAPVSPLPILKKIPGVFVLTFQSISDDVSLNRHCIIQQFGEFSQDAFTSVNIVGGKPQYLVTYNQLLPSFIVSRALARELGHIVLGHDGSLPEDVRNDEARCFANHLLAPRALLHSITATNLRLTVEVLGNLTGCYDHCLSCIRKLPATHVPADLNRQIRDNFMPYMINFFNFQRVARHTDGSALADLGSYMEGYEE